MQIRAGERRTVSAPRALQIVLLALTVGFIWGHSCMPASASGAESGSVVTFMQPLFGWLGLSGLPPETLDHLVRKLAHFSEFAILGFQIRLLIGRRELIGFARSFVSGFFVAFVDESIQLFAPGRSGEIKDVWLDACGVLTGVLLALLLLRCVKKRTEKENGSLS